MSIQEEKNDQPKPIKGAKPDVKLWEFCPFCKLRRKIQTEIKKLVKERFRQ